METKGTTGEETISYWFDLPIDVAEFEEKLGIGAESQDYCIIEKVLPYADEVHEHTSVYQLTFTQITWFVITEFIIILFGDMPPLSMIEGAFLKYFGIPVSLTWFMSQKTFDGKKPYSFLKSQITYALRPITLA